MYLISGSHLITMNHLHLIMERFESHQHGLRTEDVVRKDRQNWASVQRLMFPCVQNCLKSLETGSAGRFSVCEYHSPTKAYVICKKCNIILDRSHIDSKIDGSDQFFTLSRHKYHPP